MAKARFVVKFDSAAGRPTLPTQETHGFTVDGHGVDGYGYVTCSYTPPFESNSCVILVNTTEDVILGMIAHDDFGFIEEPPAPEMSSAHNERGGEVRRVDLPFSAAERAKMVTFLISMGYTGLDVAAVASSGSREEFALAIYKLHEDGASTEDMCAANVGE